MNPEDIKGMFAEIPQKYDCVNRVMTCFQDKRWRRLLGKELAGYPHDLVLDVCSGTGDLALSCREMVGNGARIVGSDFCFPMLRVASGKSIGSIPFCCADSRKLPFADETFAAVTMGFATRNLNSAGIMMDCFREYHRVLRNGGRFINIETTRPSSRILKWLYEAHIKVMVQGVAPILSGHRDSYKYLGESMMGFYGASELAGKLAEAGFSQVDWKYLNLGTIAIHTALK